MKRFYQMRKHRKRIAIEAGLCAVALIASFAFGAVSLLTRDFENIQLACSEHEGGTVVYDQHQDKLYFYTFDAHGQYTGKRERPHLTNSGGSEQEYADIRVFRGDLYGIQRTYDDKGLLQQENLVQINRREDTTVFTISHVQTGGWSLFGALSESEGKLTFLLADFDLGRLSLRTYTPEAGVCEEGVVSLEGLAWDTHGVYAGNGKVVFSDRDSRLFVLTADTAAPPTEIVQAGAVGWLAAAEGTVAYYDLSVGSLNLLPIEGGVPQTVDMGTLRAQLHLQADTVTVVGTDDQKAGRKTAALSLAEPASQRWLEPIWFTPSGVKESLPMMCLVFSLYPILRLWLFLLFECRVSVMIRILLVTIPLTGGFVTAVYHYLSQNIYNEIKLIQVHRLETLVARQDRLDELGEAVLDCQETPSANDARYIRLESLLEGFTDTDWTAGPHRSMLYYAVIVRRDATYSILASPRYPKGSNLAYLYKSAALETLYSHQEGYAEAEGRRTYYFYQTPVLNERGETTALLEFGIDLNMVAETADMVARHQARMILVVFCLLTALFLPVLHSVLRSLRPLKSGVERITSGNHDVRVPVTSKDEIGDISKAFNVMSAYVDQKHRESLSYNRFVPEEISALLGENTASAKAGDHAELTAALLGVSLEGVFSASESQAEIFERFERLYTQLAGTIAGVNGYFQPMSGSLGIALFQSRPHEILDTALALYESLREEDPCLILDYGMVTAAVMGPEHRLQLTVVSEMTEGTRLLQGIARDIGAGLLLSEDFFRTLSNPERYRYRYLGRIDTGGKAKGYYDFFDADTPQRFQLKQSSLAHFNDGIACFYGGKRARARDRFVRVLRVFPEDNLSRRYLALCQEEGERCLQVKTTLN